MDSAGENHETQLAGREAASFGRLGFAPPQAPEPQGAAIRPRGRGRRVDGRDEPRLPAWYWPGAAAPLARQPLKPRPRAMGMAFDICKFISVTLLPCYPPCYPVVTQNVTGLRVGVRVGQYKIRQNI